MATFKALEAYKQISFATLGDEVSVALAIVTKVVIAKQTIMAQDKGVEQANTDRQVLEMVRGSPYLANMKYAFQTASKLYVVFGLFQ